MIWWYSVEFRKSMTNRYGCCLKDAIQLKSSCKMGNWITSKGIKVDPEKVHIIQNMATSDDVGSLHRFLGMDNYVGTFILNLTTIKSLQVLTKKAYYMNVVRITSSIQLSERPVLTYYNPQENLIVENDVYQYSLEAALMQKGRLVAYASCSLSGAEWHYRQIENVGNGVWPGKTPSLHIWKTHETLMDHKPL